MPNKLIFPSPLRTSVLPDGTFLVAKHQPDYTVANLRERNHLMRLGSLENGTPVRNDTNFIEGDVQVSGDRVIYEICNPFPFRGCTYIDSSWAAPRAESPESIYIKKHNGQTLLGTLLKHISKEKAIDILRDLPLSTLYSVAQNSDDADELILLADFCCRMEFDDSGNPIGLRYRNKGGKAVADIDDFELFETIANNPALPDAYKEVMVLRPGVQGGSEIVGDVLGEGVEVFEYLRGNSYIPWGHYAANFAHTSIRYRISDLSLEDMQALRHLYYQRTYVRLADKLGFPSQIRERRLTGEELEQLRLVVMEAIAEGGAEKEATLWGWNFGYDFSGSGYRLHASHQMIHQQYAMVPEQVTTSDGGNCASFACGDMVADTVDRYREEYNRCFFTDLLEAIRTNVRVDGGTDNASLVIWQDENVMLFAPKAQVSQWEIQLIVTADGPVGGVGNIVEADIAVRDSLDKGILQAQQVLAELGAEMVTTIEFSKRIGVCNGQRLLYSFLPKLPWSMGAFSEAQYRFICGHYPEDFAAACRSKLG